MNRLYLLAAAALFVAHPYCSLLMGVYQLTLAALLAGQADRCWRSLLPHKLLVAFRAALACALRFMPPLLPINGNVESLFRWRGAQ